MDYLLKIICGEIKQAFDVENAVGVFVEQKILDVQGFIKGISEMFETKEGYLIVEGIHPDKFECPDNLHLSGEVEKAVEWRNKMEAQGRIVFNCGQHSKRSHSLQDFYKLTPRGIVTSIAYDQSKSAQNEPLKCFWSAIESIEKESGIFSLTSILDFLDATNGKKSGFEKELWRLNLIPDAKILTPKVNVEERIFRNLDAIEQINSMDDAVRNRLAASLIHFNKTEKRAYRLLMSCTMGDFSSAKHLDLDLVLSLMTKAKTHADQPNIETRDNTASDEQKDQKPQNPQKTVLDSFIKSLSGDKAAKDQITEFGSKVIDYTNNHAPFEDDSSGEKPSIEDPKTGTIILYPATKIDRNLYKIVMSSSTIDNWGGVILSKQSNLHDAIADADEICADSESFNAFRPCINECNPFFSKNIGLKTEFERFDSVLNERGKHSKLTTLFDKIVLARNELLPYLDALLRYGHLAVFGCNSNALSAVKKYVAGWKELYDEFERVEEDMHEISDNEYQHAARCLLSLDVLFFRVKDEWKAIMLPSNPLFLWIYSEVYGQIDRSEYNFAEEEFSHPFQKALNDLPNLINFQLVPREIFAISDSGCNDDYILPCSGSQGILPTFENKTNRYLGSDGMECIEDTINRYLVFAPYAGNDLRVCAVDVPDVMECVRIISKCILERSIKEKKKTSATLEIYLTSSHSGGREMDDLDFAKQDSDVSDLIQTDNLRIKVVHCGSVKDVTEYLKKDPIHLAFYFDQSIYQVSYGVNTRELYITPLVVTYDFKYDVITHDGQIYPNTDTNNGFLGSYYGILNKTGSVCSQSGIPHTSYLKTQELEQILDVVNEHYAQWLIVADRVVYNYVPRKGLPIGVKNFGRRNVCIWANKNSRVIQQFLVLLKKYNLHPSQEILVEIFNRFGHISGEGLVGIPAKVPGGATDSRCKGMLGTIFAAKWYADHYPNSLITSLDSSEGRTWISKTDEELSDNNRADLIGFRLSPKKDQVIVDILEVKTRGTENKDFSFSRINGIQIIKGHAVNQIVNVLKRLDQVFQFDSSDNGNMFIAARRETLKYQIVNECFRSKYLDDTQIQIWSKCLKEVFAGSLPVAVSGTILHVDLENNSCTDNDKDGICTENSEYKLNVVSLTAGRIQRDIFGDINVLQDSPSMHTQSQSHHSSVETENTIPKPNENIIEPDSLTNAVSITPEHVSFSEDSDTSGENVQELITSFKRACSSFSIRIAECNIETAKIGPSVIRFFLRLHTGQKIDSLRRSLMDIGRQISHTQIRIQQVENTDLIAVDIARKNRMFIQFEDVVSLLPKTTKIEEMPILIGQTPEGENLIRQLDAMPHLLVGGTTGSGKSVFLSTILLSLLIGHPNKEQLQLLIASSKPEDFIAFESLPHLMSNGILSSATDAVNYIQNDVFKESERRQKLFLEERVSKIAIYNQHMREKGLPQLPPVVVLVDEFADLADNIDNREEREVFFRTLRQIAQAGRSRGIHLILCTQRPSARLLDTNIKAQLPGRVALMVADSNSAKMILDTPDSGAERLQGRGDLLFKDNGGVLSRAQGYSLNLDNLPEIVEKYCVNKE